MPVFKYRAVGEDGKIVEAVQSADSKEQLMKILQAKKQIPILIKEEENVGRATLHLLPTRVKTKDIAIFCRQFYTMFKAGIPIVSCMDTLRSQTENKKLKSALEVVYEELQEGATFSESLKRQPKVFPDLLVHMSEAGDASGTLDTIMLRMADHYEKENKINTKIKGAMIYPVILLILLIVVVIGMLVFVMPTFVTLFKDSGADLPKPTMFLISLSDWVVMNWYIIVGVVVALVYGVNVFIKTENGRRQIDRLKLELPYFKDISKKVITSRFTRTLSTLLSSGIPLLQALDITSKVLANVVAEGGIQQASESVSKGTDLSAPIKNTGIFPPMVVSMIKIGEDSGTLDDILDQTANFYDAEVEASMQAMTSVLEPIMIIIMAVIIGAIVVAMMLPMMDMMNALDSMTV